MEHQTVKNFETFGPAIWDFFAESTGRKTGLIGNIHSDGCLLKTSEAIEARRWIRLMIQCQDTNLWFTAIGRALCSYSLSEEGREESQSENNLKLIPNFWIPARTQLWIYGIEFTFPNYLTVGGTVLTFALSNKKPMVRSWRSLNSRSANRPGFFL